MCTTEYAYDWFHSEQKIPFEQGIITQGQMPKALEMLVGNNVKEILAYIDTRNHGKCYIHQLETLMDIAKHKYGQMGSFPMEQNEGIINHVKPWMEIIANEVGSNSYMYFYDVFPNPNERITKQNFLQRMQMQNFKYTLPEVNLIEVFKSLKIDRDVEEIIVYHFLSAIDSFCKEKPTDITKSPQAAKVETPKAPQKLEDSIVSQASELDPLTDALNKLKEFMLRGKNGRPYTSRDLFGMFDMDKNGSISNTEFMDGISRKDLDLTENQRNLLLNTADLNKNGIIDYEEFVKFLLSFQEEPSIASFEDPEFFSVKTRPLDQLLGLDHGLVYENLAKDPEQAIKYAIYNLKLYTESNYGTTSAIENIFFKLDDETEGYLSETAFLLALERLKLGFNAKQKEQILSLAERTPGHDIKYKEFIDLIYNFDDWDSSVLGFAQKEDLDRSHMSQNAVSLISNSLKNDVQ